MFEKPVRNLWRFLPLAVMLSPASRAEIGALMHSAAGATGILVLLFGIALLPMFLAVRKGKVA